MSDINEAIARVAEHAKILHDGQAPHQQPLANDLQALVDHVNLAAYSKLQADFNAMRELHISVVTSLNTQLSNLKVNVDTLIDERDKARDEVREINRRRETTEEDAAKRYEALEQKLAAKDKEIEDLVAQATKPSGLGIASAAGATFADIKDAAKSTNKDPDKDLDKMLTGTKTKR